MQNKIYLVDTKRFFSIWFSDVKDNFLNPENQLRLLKKRRDNPEAQISFVYSSKLLSEEALLVMGKFCKAFKIVTFDIDTDLPKFITTTNDRKLYHLVTLELDKWIKKEGGNVAAASDYSRWIQALVERCGNYIELDISTNLTQLEKFVPVGSPIIFECPTIEKKMGNDKYYNLVAINNSIIFYAVDDDNKSALHQDTITKIGLMQQELLKKSTDLKYAIMHNTQAHVTTPDLSKNLLLELFKYFSRKENNHSIYNFRLFVQRFDQKVWCSLIPQKSWPEELRELNWNTVDLDTAKTAHSFLYNQTFDTTESDCQLLLLKHELFKYTVWNVTGALLLPSLIHDIDRRKVEYTMYNNQISMTLDSFQCVKTLGNFFHLSDLKKNNLLRCFSFDGNSCYENKKTASIVNKNIDEIMSSSITLTWTDSGRRAMQKRDEVIENAAISIQRQWRKVLKEENELRTQEHGL